MIFIWYVFKIGIFVETFPTYFTYTTASSSWKHELTWYDFWRELLVKKVSSHDLHSPWFNCSDYRSFELFCDFIVDSVTHLNCENFYHIETVFFRMRHGTSQKMSQFHTQDCLSFVNKFLVRAKCFPQISHCDFWGRYEIPNKSWFFSWISSGWKIDLPNEFHMYEKLRQESVWLSLEF